MQAVEHSEAQGAEGVKELRGLQRICRLYGRMQCGDVMMVWDYANECALPEAEMRADKARWAASEKVKWGAVKRKGAR